MLPGAEMAIPDVQKPGGDRAWLIEKSQLMSSSGIEWALERLAREIVERQRGTDGLLLVGIHRRGVPLANRLAKKIWEIVKFAPPVKALSISFYRADLSTIGPRPLVENPTLPFSVEDKTVILVDDVLYTGRTVCAALNALTSDAEPRQIQLCVLIDRGHRRLPIRPDYVGRIVHTTESEVIEVRLSEVDNEDRVVLCQKIQGEVQGG